MPSLRLGDIAPDFEQDSSLGRIRFHEWLGDSWAVLFTHPADFTPVCTTELGECARLKSEFDRRHVKVIGLSVDNANDHERWIADINETQQTQVNFPIIADKDRAVSRVSLDSWPASATRTGSAGRSRTWRWSCSTSGTAAARPRSSAGAASTRRWA